MCGIVGLYGDDLNVDTPSKRGFIIEGTIADTVRGYESTGIFTVARNPKDGHRLYKKAIAGYDFAQLKQFNKIVDQMSTSVAMVVHNRASTRGQGHLDNNAHPFRFGNITLVHNGTVTNAFSLVPYKDRPDLQVDSAAVAHAFSHESAEDMLPRLEGGYSLVWHDSNDGTLNFARNDLKPMFLAFDARKEVMYFGSEVRMITWLAHRNGIQLQDKIFNLSPHIHYIFRNPKEVRSIAKRPFVPGRSLVTVLPPARTSSTHTPTATTTSTTTSTQGTPWEPTAITKNEKDTHPVVEERLSATVSDFISTSATNERLDRLKSLMAQANLLFNQTIVAVPRMWKPYTTKRQGKPTGVMICYLHGDEDKRELYQVFGVTEEAWRLNFRGLQPIKLKVINFRDPQSFENHPTVFVCKLVEEPKEKHSEASDKGGQSTDLCPSDEIEIGTAQKRRVSLQVYRRLTDNGCYNCTCPLPEHEASTIMWIGKHDDYPVCGTCSGNMQIVNSLAMTVH